MRKNWLLIGIALLAAGLAIGAIACSDDDEDAAPTATEGAIDAPIALPDGATSTVIVTDGILTDSAGNTLYIFDNDEAGVSNCTEDCTGIWPPLTVDGESTAGDGVGTLATFMRDDGSLQVTHEEQPLYYYSADDAPGDRNGDGLGGIWHIIVVG